MSAQLTAVNPAILIWARERAGLSVDDAAAQAQRTVDQLSAWESGTEAPTYAQLEKLAYKVYRRPLAIFFFPEPPEEPLESQEFRTLPDFELRKLSPDTRYAVREAKAMQISLFELGEDRNPSERKIFADVKLKKSTTAEELARVARKYLRVSVEEQIRWASPQDAFKAWRDAVQTAGIFVFKRPFKQTEVSGFCLVDEEFPIIYINNSTTFSRQVFTLHHELAHVLLGFSGMTTADSQYIDELGPYNKRVEVFANAFAAALLVPADDFDRLVELAGVFDDSFVQTASDRYNVSREVVLRRLLDKGLVEQSDYEEKAREWSDGYQRRSSSSKNSGGDYYASKAVYLGKSYLDLAFSKFYRGHFGEQKLAEHLDLKPSNLSAMESYYMQRVAD